MRRFLIWSALAALIGLVLAGAGYWAYWNFYSRFQPITVSRHQSEIQRLLDEASWVSDGGGGAPLYVIGYRDGAAMQRYEREEVPKLRAAGIEPRIILFARADREGLSRSTAAERATVAELWLTRDWTLYQRWTAIPARSWTAAGLPPSDGSLARSGVVEAGRQFAARLADLLQDEGLQVTYPLVLWRDRDGFLRACACGDSRSWTFVRDDLGAPDRLASTTTEDRAPATEAPDRDAAPLPYPALPAIPAIPPLEEPAAPPSWSTEPPTQAEPPATGRPSQARPAPAQRPATPRPAPQARKQDDATFF